MRSDACPFGHRSGAALLHLQFRVRQWSVDAHVRDVAPNREGHTHLQPFSRASLHPLLALQRSAGNCAVTGMLTGSACLIQRQDAGSGSGSGGAASVGTSVSLAHAAKFDGKVLVDKPGWRKNKGECATGVQYVFHEAGTPLGLTPTWKQGIKVRGNKVPPGTAIASFRNGKFAQDHAAILIRETADGLEVWDQYNRPSKPWGKRVLRFSKDNDRSNNGNLFYVIEH